MVSLNNMDEVDATCYEEFAQDMINDIQDHASECQSAAVRKAINFCGRKFRFPNSVNAELIVDMKLKIKIHSAAAINQAPSISLV